MFYAKSTGGFYDSSIHTCMPADVVEISKDFYDALFAGQSKGKRITADAKGFPALTDPPAQSITDIKAIELEKVRALRATFFPTLAGLQSEALARGNTADALAIATVQQQCRDITKIELSAFSTQAQVDAAFTAAWTAIVSAAPSTVRLAFAALKS
jgi:hypothetical protein